MKGKHEKIQDLYDTVAKITADIQDQQYETTQHFIKEVPWKITNMNKFQTGFLEQRIDKIEDQFERVLANHEKDFIQAYKVSLFLISKPMFLLGPYDSREKRAQVPQGKSPGGSRQADQRPGRDQPASSDLVVQKRSRQAQ